MDIHLKVKPNARQNAISFENGDLIVRVKAPPTEGKANKELLDYLSKILQVPKSRIELASGESSKFKKICIPAAYETTVARIIASLKS